MQRIRKRLRIRLKSYRLPFRCRPCQIVNGVSGLNVVAIDIEIDALSLIRQGICLDAYASGNQLAGAESGRHPVVDASAAGENEIAHLGLIGQHALDIHVAGSRYQVSLLGIHAG